MFLQKLKTCFSIFPAALVFSLALILGAGAGSIVPTGALHAQEMEEESTPEPVELNTVKKTVKKKSKDFQKTLEAKKAAQAKPAASKAVKAGDLMDAMRESINPAPPAPIAPSAPPVVDVPALPTQAAEEKIPAPPPPAEIQPTKDFPAPLEGEKPRKLFSASPEASQPASTLEAVKELPKVEVPKAEAPKTETPKTETLKSEVKVDQPAAAPLLSDVNEAPSLLGSSKPVVDAPAQKEEKPAETPKPVEATAPAPQLPPVPEGFSKPRALFSAPGSSKKRQGVRSVKPIVETAPEMPPAFSGEMEQALPPVDAGQESIIKPIDAAEPVKSAKENSSAIWKSSAPVNDKGSVVYSQKAESAEALIQPIEENVVEVEERKTFSAMPEDAKEGAAPPARLSSNGNYNPAAGPMLHASCGAASGVGTDIKPANYLCTQGNASPVSGNGPWSWSCLGSNGGTNASCSAPLQVNGECGMANGSQSASAPASQLCKTGSATGLTGNGPWYWSCLGDNGGVVAQCAAYTLVSGACGSAHNNALDGVPSSGLCASGTPTAVLGEGPWTWNCVGSGEGTTTNCMAQLRVSGVCGSASGVGFASAPNTDLCASGTPSRVSGSGPWSWSCDGDNGGASMQCSATTLTNASCGAAHGIGVDIQPAAALCNAGTASEVSGTGPWMWTCYGENGGAPSDCMAPLKVNGICGAAHQNGSADKPLSGLCSSGTPSQVTGSGPWQWSCMGASGGITANCIAQPLQHAACGPAHGVSVATPPTAGLCNEGTPTSVIGSGPFLWSCQGTQGGAAANCMAPLQVNGACGAADALPVLTAPSTGLCNSGIASAVTGSGPWIWTCQGAGGGISTTCQAPMQQAETKAAEPPAAVQVPKETATAGNECTPSVKRWTITCQQGGYPSNYTGVIVGETQVLCPTGVERGVWLSNSCAPATNSAPVSPSPGVLKVPPPPSLPKVMEKLPEIKPIAAADILPPRKLATPRFKGADENSAAPAKPDDASISFAPSSEGLDASATGVLDGVAGDMAANDKAIITLNAYAPASADGSQQESRRLALARALAARSYLMRKGIASTRIDVRAIGPASDGLGDDRVDIQVK